jgi:isoleucyl-tRNA synthetase
MAQETDYKDTLNLPKTEFPMRGNLAQREPELLAKWRAEDLAGQITRARAGGPRFVLHDGPPYTSGNIHYGHILNKTLKDLVVKYRTMAGYAAPYVPGFDTHGLPIELQVEREVGAKKAQMTPLELRHACHAVAMKWLEVQRTEFQRLGVFGEWQKPYATLDPAYEAQIVRALAAFARRDLLYRGKKPVHWCLSCQTALAEAEIEYETHRSPSVYVRMALGQDGGALAPALAGKPVSLVIWTTTPWTLPANLAIVMWPAFEYVAIPSGRADGEHLVVAKARAAAFLEACKLAAPEATWVPIPRENLGRLEGARYQHPFIPTPRADADFRIWFADHVTLDAGTGLVHTAPGHGADDYGVGQAHGLDTYAPVDDAGRFTSDVPLWAGQGVFAANFAIAAHLLAIGALLNGDKDSISHQYPCCWRCKNPIVFRATPQWFLALDGKGELRKRSLAAIDETRWIPPWGRNRIHGMVANRPDWCLSRQRAWGVPLPIFHCERCDHALVDGAVMEHVADRFAKDGGDVWFTADAEALLPPGQKCPTCQSGSFRKEKAIVDVWFESGVSWFAVCEPRPDMGVPVDLYLEGSDQHRGWFHSSLLTAVAITGRAPYKAVLTHGFVLDERGRPYSKSEIEKARKEGIKIEFIPPDEVIKASGAELLRLWVASVEFRGDMTYSRTILNQLGESYRKYRNTCRFVLGNLFDFDPAKHAVALAAMPEIDRFAMARLDDVIARVRKAYDDYEFHAVFRALVDYVTVELSALYLDISKDRLYCDAPDWASRRSAQTVLWHMGRALATLAAPILCFTAEDVWSHLPRGEAAPTSVHLALLPEGRPLAATDPLVDTWTRLLGYRERALAVIEPFRAQKHHPLDAQVTIRPPTADRALLVGRELELADLFVVSRVVLGPDATGPEAELSVEQAPGTRCDRCWRYHDGGGALCGRCVQALADRQKKGAA